MNYLCILSFYLKDDVPILFTLQLQCWELSHSILCMSSINDQSGMLLAFDFVRVTLNANVGAVVVIPCYVCMHLKSKATVSTPVDGKAFTHHVLHIASMGSNRNDGLFVVALEMSTMALCR